MDDATAANLINNAANQARKTTLQVDNLNRDMTARKQHLLASLAELEDQHVLLVAQIEDHRKALSLVNRMLRGDEQVHMFDDVDDGTAPLPRILQPQTEVYDSLTDMGGAVPPPPVNEDLVNAE